jgi:Helicase associated domain
MYGRLKAYKDREGHCRVPATHTENGFRLGAWVKWQRWRKDALSEERRKRLDELGFVWDTLEAAWEEGFSYLKAYTKREGHCRVPYNHIENGFRLGEWVRKHRWRKDTLSEERRQRLDELGFVWDALEAYWEEGFSYLKAYKKREGHCRVPATHTENGFRLGGWVNKQRWRKGARWSEERRKRLDELGFVWDTLEAAWEEGFSYLKAYKKREGHCRVPDNHKEDGFGLGGWVRRQRQSKRQESLPEARRQQLDELGFVWDAFETDWAEGLRYLTIYKEREGHCRIPRPHKENGFRLGEWAHQRRNKPLSEARRQQLDELGFFWDPDQMDWAEGLRHLTIYKEREGHCRVLPKHRENGFRLGPWVLRQRQSKTLPEARRQQLDELGFVWNALETKWAEGLRYLTIYKGREGHCRIPRPHKENGFRLGQWVDVQRRNPDKLSASRRQQLNDLGFVWHTLETDWTEGLRYLTIYKEREGHCGVPHSHKENGFRLGQWVLRQRQSKTLPEARRQQLDELGFVWNALETKWAEGLRYLTIYKNREGHCRVHSKHKEKNFSLGEWVNNQRAKKNTMPVERRQRLDELGFVWKVR